MLLQREFDKSRNLAKAVTVELIQSDKNGLNLFKTMRMSYK